MLQRFICIALVGSLAACVSSTPAAGWPDDDAGAASDANEAEATVDGGDSSDSLGSLRPIARGISTRCGDGAWCFVHPYPTGTHLYDIWSTSDDDVWFGGAFGTWLRYDGKDWNGEIGLSARQLVGFSGTAKDDVWAIDSPYRIVHWDGTTWSEVVLGGTRRPGQIAARARDDVWVRRGGYDDGSELLHFDGKSWTTVSGTPRYITALQPIGPNETWFGSREGLFRVKRGGAPERVGALANVQALWSGGTELWALAEGRVHRGDGVTSSIAGTVTSPQQLVGCGANDVYVRGNPSPVYHWDGTALRSIALPFEPSLLHCTKSGDLWIAAGSRIARRRGGTWWAPPGNRFFASDYAPSSMWGPAADDLYATAGQALLHFDGRAWSTIKEFPGQVASVSGSSATDIWLSAPITPEPSSGGGVLHKEGTEWVRKNIDGARSILLVEALAPNDVWAIDSAVPARAFHWDGTIWSAPLDLAGAYGPMQMVARSPTDIWLAMTGGLLHFNGAGWKKASLPAGEGATVTALADTSSGLLVAYGSSAFYPRVARFDGSSFTTIFMGLDYTSVGGMFGEARGNIWMIGSGIHWFDNGAWTRTAVIDLRARLYSKRAGDIWAYGSAGSPSLLRRLEPGLH